MVFFSCNVIWFIERNTDKDCHEAHDMSWLSVTLQIMFPFLGYLPQILKFSSTCRYCEILWIVSQNQIPGLKRHLSLYLPFSWQRLDKWLIDMLVFRVVGPITDREKSVGQNCIVGISILHKSTDIQHIQSLFTFFPCESNQSVNQTKHVSRNQSNN